MSTLDWIIAGFIGLGIWRGYRAGLFKSIVSTVGLVLAFLVATALMVPVGNLVTAALGVSEQVAPVAGFIVVFVIVVGGLALAGAVFRTALRTVQLGLVESVGGGIVGGIKAAFVLSIIFLATSVAPVVGSGPWMISEETRASSRLYGAIEPLAPAAWDLIKEVGPGLQEEARERFRAAEPFLP